MLFPKELKENEYVCLFLVKTDKEGKPILDKDGKEKHFHKYVKNFEQYQEEVMKFRHNYHVYNALSTVKRDRKGQLHRQEPNMRQRRVLFIDFDKKDYPNCNDVYVFSKMIKEKFPDLFLHAYYDSGHGYHFYVIIPPTCKTREITELNKEICSLVGADTDACKVTQIARIPCTYNRKHPNENGRFPLVKEIDHYKNNPYAVKHFHPCNVDYIRRNIDNAKKIEELVTKPLEKWDYAGDGYDIKVYPCLCTEKIFREGADELQRNTWLGRIISMLLAQRYSEAKIRELCLDWNLRCRPPKNINVVRDDINRYLEKVKNGTYNLKGCWENITDNRVKEIVKAQCDKAHCLQAFQKNNISIVEDIGVRMTQKLLTESKMRNDDENALSGYEYLIMTILYKYIKTGSKVSFTVKNLKTKMQYKKHGKWQLCMDVKTFKATLDRLVMHNCIELVEPTPEQCKKKNVSFDDTRIKIKRGMKALNDKYIEFYYSTARAFICKQITQNEYKVFLCIVNNIKDGKSCTIKDIGNFIHMGESHVLEAIKNLEKAQCIDIIRQKSDKGNWFNIYSQKHTDEWNEDTCNDIKSGNDMKICVDTPIVELADEPKDEIALGIIA